TLRETAQTTEKGTLLSGGSVALTAGHDIGVQGSAVAADGDVTLTAGHDITTAASIENYRHYEEYSKKKSGLLGGSALGFTIGSTSVSQKLDDQAATQSQSVSTLGSTGGSVSLRAGQNVSVAGTDMIAARDIQVVGNSVSLESGYDVRKQSRQTEQKTSGLTVSLGGLMFAPLNSLQQSIQQTRSTGDARMALLQDMRAAMTGYQSFQGGQRDLDDMGSGATTGISISFSNQRASSHEQSEQLQAFASSLSAGRDIAIVARQGDITVAGSRLKAGDTVAMDASGNINLLSAQSTLTDSSEKNEKITTVARTVSESRANTQQSMQSGSLISAGTVAMNAGQDITIQGSSIAADGDVSLVAKNNVNMLASAGRYQHDETHSTSKSGVFSSGGLNVTLGKTATMQAIQAQATPESQSVSTIGSLGGSVKVTAGQDVNVAGADVVAAKDIRLEGNNVTIAPGYDTSRQSQQFTQRTAGITASPSGAVGGAINSAVQSAQAAQASQAGGDSRLAALQGMKALLSGYQAYQGSQVSPNTGGASSLVGVSVSVGSQRSSSTQNNEQQQSFGSSLNAGHDLSLIARQGDVSVAGSQIKAGNDVELNAARALNLLSARNSESLTGNSRGSGWNVGVSFGIGSGSAGFSIFANANAAKGRELGSGNSWSETTVDAGRQVTLASGGDTHLVGAQVSGEQITARVGGDLLLQSQQDSNRYDSKQSSASAGGSFTFGSMTGSGYLSASQDKMHSSYDSVQQQTGLFAGKSGYDISVGNHTQLDAAVIGSTASADKNRLDTGTLGWSNIDNRAAFSVSHSGIGLSASPSLSMSDMLKSAALTAPSALMSMGRGGNASSTTYAAVSDGALIIRNQAGQQQDIAGLSRDLAHANNALSPIFDKEKEQKRLQMAQMVGELGVQAVDVLKKEEEIAASKKADARVLSATPEERTAMADKLSKSPERKTPVTEGEVNRALYQQYYDAGLKDSSFGIGSAGRQGVLAATAALQALVGGGNLTQAIAGASAPYLAGLVKDATMPKSGENREPTEAEIAANAIGHALVGAVVAQLSGKDAVSGAVGAASGELAARAIMAVLYPDKKDTKDLTEAEKQSVSTLASLAAGLASGIASGNTTGAATGAQAGRNAVENNFLSSTSSEKRDALAEKILKGDKSLKTAKEFLELENADQRSDALVALFNKDPASMSAGEKAELASYLRVYASEMQTQYGEAVTKELITGMLARRDNLKSAPQTEAQRKAQAIMNTWGYHKSNASIGDPVMLFGSNVLGLTIKESMAANAAIGTVVNAGSQLSGQDPFSYVDAVMAGVTAALTTGKSWQASAAINMGGAAVGSALKGENPVGSVIGAGIGSVVGGKAGDATSSAIGKVVDKTTADIGGAVVGSVVSEAVGNGVKEQVDKAGKK
ncbi:hemagglutinin repeat-containing protein, partial [Dickeya fangzhongdai]